MTIIKAQIEDRIRSDRRNLITSFVRDIPLLKEDRRTTIRRLEERQLSHDNLIISNWLARYHTAKPAAQTKEV